MSRRMTAVRLLCFLGLIWLPGATHADQDQRSDPQVFQQFLLESGIGDRWNIVTTARRNYWSDALRRDGNGWSDKLIDLFADYHAQFVEAQRPTAEEELRVFVDQSLDRQDLLALIEIMQSEGQNAAMSDDVLGERYLAVWAHVVAQSERIWEPMVDTAAQAAIEQMVEDMVAGVTTGGSFGDR